MADLKLITPEITALSTGNTTPSAAAPAEITYPHSVEAEQGLLGALLYNNTGYDDLGGRLLPEHFYVPFHAEVFSQMERLINKGFEASPLTLREQMKNAPFAEETDLFRHFTQMLENAQYTQDVIALSEVIHAHYLQRQLLKVGIEIQRDAAEAGADHAKTEETLEAASGELFRLAESGASSTTVQTLKNPLQQVIERAEAARTQGTSGVPTQFIDLDDKLGGFQNSDLVILAARPSMGKTAFALNMAYNIASRKQRDLPGGKAVGFFSLEMSSDQLAARMLSTASGINSISLSNGTLSDADFGRLIPAVDTLSELPLYLDDTPGLAITALRARARKMKRQYDIGVLFVDYLQLLHGSTKASKDNRVQEVSEISMTLKSIARELNIPVIALSQLSRAVEQRDNKRPQLSDLRESGSIEQDADIVMFLYREEYYLEKQLGLQDRNPTNTDDIGDAAELSDSKEEKEMAKIQERLQKVRGTVELLISKNRKGATGGVALTFTAETTTFSNHSKHGR